MDVPIEKKRFPKSKLIMIGLGILFAFLLLYVFVFSSSNSKLNVDKERLSINTIHEGVFQENISVNGVVLPITTIYLDAVEGGRVEEKFVEDGAFMKKANPF